MANIKQVKNRSGIVTGYRVRICVGRDHDYRQVFRTKTFPRPEGLTPARERKEIERLADEYEQDQRAEYEASNTHAASDRISLADFVNKHWFPDSIDDGHTTPSSVAFYRHAADNVLKYFGQRKLLSAITTEDCKRYCKWLQTTARTKQGKPFAPTTQVHYSSCLKSILDYARRMHYLKKNPFDDLTKADRPSKKRKKIDFLTSEEAHQFMACLQDEPVLFQMLFNIFIVCGLRRGEAVGLQWGDLDEEHLEITVRRNVTVDSKAKDGTRYHIGDVKTETGQDRIVPISQRMLDMLHALKAEQIKAYDTITDSCYIFCHAEDPTKPLYPSTPTRMVANFEKHHNLRSISPHDLRHSAATLALEGGADIKQIQALLGHADPSTTMKFYAGISKERQHKTTESIEKILKGCD